MTEPQSRTYVVGLPVIVTVSDSGTVTYEVDIDEAATAMVDARVDGITGTEVNDIEFHTDLGRVEADHERRRLSGSLPVVCN